MGDATDPPFGSFREFYPYYLAEHSNRWNRRLHFAGQVLAVSLLVGFAATLDWWLLLAAPLAGYGVSWVGHFLVEGNRPATFRHPLYSLRGDVTMCWDMLTGRVPF
ncbi:MAG: DUF962 domain-containing protein [Gemmataceae bacterium]